MADTPTVICYGSISLDNVVRLPHLPSVRPHADVTADYYQLGGEALGVALPLGAWGHAVAVAGNTLGEDPYADFILGELERHPNVSVGWLHREPHVRTPFSRILATPDGARQVLSYWFAQVPKQPLLPETLAGARLLSTDAHGGKERIAAARLARERGLRVVVSDLIWPEHELLPLADLVVLSRAFLQSRFAGVDVEGHLRHLHERSGATIVMSSGPEPLLIVTAQGQLLEIPPYPLPALDRMGAGHLLTAGLIHGLLEPLPLLDAIRFANAAAALWVAQPPALKRPPTLNEVAALLEERAPHIELPAEGECVCPICRRMVPPALFEKHWAMDRRVVRALRDRHPAWRRADGACPCCVQEAVREAGITRFNATTLPPEMAQHPIYAQGEPHALPIGVRLRANPHYAGRGVTIAFLDSGFYPHPDLLQPESRILTFVDASSDEIVVGADFTVPRLSSWHGTMTSVVAAGNGFLSGGYYTGLAREARLLPIKVSTPAGHIDEADILRGLRWLAAHWQAFGVGVVNLSVGGDEGLRPDAELNRLVNHLVAEGLVVVAAAGNLGSDALCPPASAAGAITVGGLDDRNTLDPTTNRMWHSNWGYVEGAGLKPELIAPSIWLAAPVLPGTPTAEQNLILDRLYREPDEALPELLAHRLHELGLPPGLMGKPVEAMRRAVLDKLLTNKFVTPFYQHVDGTSFAAPIVSSVVAQMLEANPALTPARCKELLIATAARLPGVPEFQQGYGVVQPGQAVAAALHERRGRYEPGDLSPQVGPERVRFILREPNATQVSVIGSWNEWHPERLPMHEREPGVWVAEMARPAPARYPYKFWVDGSRWLDDPENRFKSADGYGGFSAVLAVE